MAEKQETKVSVTVVVDRTLLERVDSAIRHLPPGWDRNLIFEVGAFELLEQLARKHNKGEPFPL